MTAKTHDIKTAAVKKAIILLKSADASFAIIFNDEKHGTLEITKKPTRAKRKNYMQKYGYMTALRNLEPGRTAEFFVEREDLQGMQSTTDTAMRKLYGKGSYMTSIRSGKLAVFRLLQEETAEAN